jgi:hypothetical protein
VSVVGLTLSYGIKKKKKGMDENKGELKEMFTPDRFLSLKKVPVSEH